MYHIGLYTCNGLKYTSEVQRGAPLGGHHRWENNKRKRAPRALCRLYCWWVSTILSCFFTFIRECVCVCTRRTADDDESCCWRSFMRGLYTEWLIRQHWKYIRGGGIRRSWLTRSFWPLLCHGWWPMFVTLIPRSYGYTAVNAPHTTSKAATAIKLPPESVPHDHPSIQQLLRRRNNSLAYSFFLSRSTHTPQ